MTLTLVLLGFNLVGQVLSGWKGLVLWTMITLGVMLFPMMPRRIVFGGIAFVLFWMLYIHPFGLAFRELLWYRGAGEDTAVTISIGYALNMSFEERLDNIWLMMVSRANELWQFEKYYRYVPATRPYYGFELAEQALLGLVPRILWPEKPDLERVAMQRVYDAGVVSEESIISAKSNLYQDAYLSAGTVGIVLFSLFFGMLSTLVNRTCERLFGGYDIGTCLIYTSLFSFWFNTAPNFLFFVGATFTSLLVVFGLFAVGRLMGWIVPARPLHQMPAGHTALAGRPAISPGSAVN
jgi:hypothetical protein